MGWTVAHDNKRLEGTEYKENNWLVLNFNDSLSAFGAWVVMLLCEYVPKYAEAVFTVLDPPYNRTWLIFLVFYFCGVCIVFELVKAFTIEVFLGCWGDKQAQAKADAAEKKKKEEEAKKQARDQAEADKKQHPNGGKPKQGNVDPGKRKNERKKQQFTCFCFEFEDEIEDASPSDGGGSDELEGLKKIKQKLKAQGLCLHYTGGNKKKMKQLQEEFDEQMDEEEDERAEAKAEESTGGE